MAMADDLVNLGLPPLLAAHVAQGGTGALSISAAGSTFADGTAVKAEQYSMTCTNSDGTMCLALPAIGGDNGALLCDRYTINNAGASSLQIFASTGVLISMNGSNGSKQTILSHTSAILWPVGSNQWAGVVGN